MIRINDIASEIQSFLGDEFTIHVDHNLDTLHNIKTNQTFKKSMIDYENTINALMTTSIGQVVALPDLFSTSYGFSLTFFVPTGKSIESNINALTVAKNGQLVSVDGNKYLMTFNTPNFEGLTEAIKGKHYQVINLSGSIAVTDHSLFGNELKVSYGSHDLTPMIISSEISMGMTMTEPENEDTTLIPQMDYAQSSNAVTLTLHLRKDSAIVESFLEFLFNPDLLRNEHQVLTFAILGKTIEWTTKLTAIDTVFSIGGYVILNVSFQRVKVID